MIIKGLSTKVVITGDGIDTILFLHGWGSDTSGFDGAAKFYSKKYKTVNLDLWGHGQSFDPPKDFTIFDYADNIKALLDELGINKTNIVAHSFGGRLAIILAARYPHSVNKLILIDSGGLRPRFSAAKAIRILNYKCRRKLFKSGIIKKFDESKYGSSDYKKLSADMKQVFKNIVNVDLTEDAKKINAATLILWGKHDRDTPLYMGKKLNRLITGSKLIVLPGGHYSYIDNFDKFLTLVNEFLI